MGCHLPKAKFDSAFNPEREKIGLAPLPPDWPAISVDKDFTVWRVPQKTGVPQLYSITVTYDQDHPLSEVDRYNSGRTFRTIDGADFETLDIGYYFEEKQIGVSRIKGWRCEYAGRYSADDKKDTTAPVFHRSTVISLAEADSILKSWGLRPPARP
jgi:hypothetical protein